MTTIAKTTRLPSSLLRGVKYRTRKEGVDESTSLRQLLTLGLQEYAVQLYREGKIGLPEAAELSNQNVREMLDILELHGVRGNVQYETQSKSLEIVKRLTS